MRKSFAFLFILFLAVSCNKELEVNAEWKDVSVIYGILDKTKDTNYVRIHRGYLGDEGFAGGSQNPDSIYYQSPNVSIQILKGGDTIPVQLVKDESIALDSGFFTSEDYHVYRFDRTLQDDERYRLSVKKSEEGLNETYAVTPMVRDFRITDPKSANFKISFLPNGERFAWDNAVNGRLYQTTLRFNYLEMDKVNRGDTVLKHVDFLVATRTGNNLAGREPHFTALLEYDVYYNYLISTIGVNPDVIRFTRGIDVIVTAAADDFATYMSVSGPANTVVQDRPHYTNILGGDGANAGIFSSTNTVSYDNMELAKSSLDSLIFGDLTCDLQFGYLNALDTCWCSGGKYPVCN